MTALLIVDDSKTARVIMKHWIKAIRPDYTLMEAGSPAEAMEFIEELQSDDLAILDYNMPGATGVELAEQLAAKIPVTQMALVTANIQDAVKGKAGALGMHYLPKPVTPVKVKEIIEKMEQSVDAAQ